MRASRLLSVLAFAVLLAPAAAAAQDSRPGIAVLPFTNGGSYGLAKEDLDALQVGVQELLITELAQNPALRVVDRSRIREIVAEIDLGASGRVDAQTAARVGRLVGARYVVTGVFVDLNGDFRMDARIVDGETSEIVKSQQVRGERDDLFDLLVDLSTRITQDVNLPPLPADVQEARKEQEIPAEAITLFSRAQVYADAGRTEQAIQLYERIAQRFPEMAQAKEALRQLRGS
jgi:TolB-like protein